MINALSKQPPAARKVRWRSFWLTWHLYLGLSLGLVFVLAGLTGSLLVFYLEIDELINPELEIKQEQRQLPKQNYETLYRAIKARHPERTGPWRLEVPRNSEAMLMARYYRPIEKEHLIFAPLIVWVNPYTAEVTSSRFWGDFVMTWLYDLHYALLLDKTGKTIMGIIGIVLLIPLITGIYLWWPKFNKLKTALSIKRNTSSVRFNYDLHKVCGIYSWIVLILLLLTGSLLELPDYVHPLIDRVSTLYKTPAVLSTRQNHQPITLDQAAQIALSQFPSSKLRWLETPKDTAGTYRIVVYQEGEPSTRFPKTTLWIDQYSGKILAIRNPKQHSSGDILLSWLHPLHSGEMFSMPGRIIVCISGLIPLVLYITGFIRWRQKRKAKASNKHRSISAKIKL